MTNKVDALVKLFNQSTFENQMNALCKITIDQQLVFRRQYVPMINAAQALGEILAGPNPQSADIAPKACPPAPAGTDCPTPRDRAQKLQSDFIDYYKRFALTLEDGVDTIHAALMPNQGSLLRAYGRVLLANRFITRTDSEALRALSANFSQTEALACWKDAEYRASDIAANADAFNDVITGCLSNLGAEPGALPPMIPDGAVIDLTASNGASTDKKPMWLPPTTQDQGWLPAVALPWPNHNIPTTYRNDEVDHVITAMNARTDIPGDDGTPKQIGRWKVPNRAQLTALMSDGCVVTPDDMTRFVGTCKNRVPSNGGDLLGYLLKLNPTNTDWQALFCENSKVISCANGGAGPAGTPPHAYVWTSDRTDRRMECGYTLGFFFVHLVSSVVYNTYTGFRTASNDPAKAWQAVPAVPSQVPEYGLQNDDIAHDFCNKHFVGLTRSPLGQAVVLATRYTGQADLNTNANIDYMAQPGP